MKRVLFLTIIILMSTTLVWGQDARGFENPPVNFELLVANKGLDAELLVVKKTRKYPRLGFFSATSIISDWKSSTLDDFMHQTALTYELVKGLDIDFGYEYTPFTDFRASAGFMYNFFSRDWAFNISPRVDVSGSNNTIEEFSFVSYTPQLSENVQLYTRLQTLYNIQINNGDHQRSYLWLRVGITQGDFTYGVGANFDRYGPEKFSKHNFGIFAAMDLF